MPAAAVDPWATVGDLDGRAKYRVLEVSYFASPDEIKKAYRELARRHHPDKGGDALTFSAIQEAFETLSNKARRAVYDEWAKQFKFRHAYQPKASGGEDLLFQELEQTGLSCDPRTQLLLLCEVCRRPATKECWTCKMPLCSFCTLKRHWKEGFPLHWPLINSDHMQTQLAKRELEKKRTEDARLLDMEDPNWRSQSQLQDIRSFKIAACRMLERPDRLVYYDYELARFYMWAQTAGSIHLAVHVPTGYEDRELQIDCNEHVLRIQPDDSPAVVERAFAGGIDMSQPVTTFRIVSTLGERPFAAMKEEDHSVKTADNRTLVLSFCKRDLEEHWPCLFRGDSYAVRSMQPPYRISETPRDVSLEVDLPPWVDADDVKIDFGPADLTVRVTGNIDFKRTYWAPKDAGSQKEFRAVEAEESMWSLETDKNANGELVNVLLLSLVKPEPSEEEITWKRGKRQDNLTAERPGRNGTHGFRFFRDDEDDFELEDVLQAVCFMETGETFVPAKPWHPEKESTIARSRRDLSSAAQQHLAALLKNTSSADGEP